MPKINPNSLTKLYYSIGEVADLFEVNTSLIRFWEKEFSLIQPQKSKGGTRKYTPKDILNIDKVYSLVRQKGYTIEGAKKALKKNEKSFENTANEVVVEKLQAIKKKLIEIKQG
jgi:DNA-binding transcriptional MerR regulator